MQSHGSTEERSSLVPAFHEKLKQRLRAHFIAPENSERPTTSQIAVADAFLSRVNSIIQNRLDDEQFDMVSLSRDMLLSRSQLYRRLKPLIKQSPAQYIKFVRLQKAKELLEQTDSPVGEIAFRTGFVNQSHFTRSFQKEFGVNPSAFRRKKPHPVPYSNTDL